jgi:hypothetical protein
MEMILLFSIIIDNKKYNEEQACCFDFDRIETTPTYIQNKTLYYCDNERYYNCKYYTSGIISFIFFSVILLICFGTCIYFCVRRGKKKNKIEQAVPNNMIRYIQPRY